MLAAKDDPQAQPDQQHRDPDLEQDHDPRPPAQQVTCPRGHRSIGQKDHEGLRYQVFSPVIGWVGSRMNLSGSNVRCLQMNVYGVRPLRVFRRRPKV